MPQPEDQIATQRRSFVSKYVEAHDAEARGVRDELDRLALLLDDAVARLSDSFETIYMLSAESRGAEAASREASPSDELQGRLNDAATALQFHDIATQILAQSRKRIALIEQMTGRLGHLPYASLDELTKDLACSSARVANPVSQSHMAVGAVELF